MQIAVTQIANMLYIHARPELAEIADGIHYLKAPWRARFIIGPAVV